MFFLWCDDCEAWTIAETNEGALRFFNAHGAAHLYGLTRGAFDRFLSCTTRLSAYYENNGLSFEEALAELVGVLTQDKENNNFNEKRYEK